MRAVYDRRTRFTRQRQSPNCAVSGAYLVVVRVMAVCVVWVLLFVLRNANATCWHSVFLGPAPLVWRLGLTRSRARRGRGPITDRCAARARRQAAPTHLRYPGVQRHLPWWRIPSGGEHRSDDVLHIRPDRVRRCAPGTSDPESHRAGRCRCGAWRCPPGPGQCARTTAPCLATSSAVPVRPRAVRARHVWPMTRNPLT